MSTSDFKAQRMELPLLLDLAIGWTFNCPLIVDVTYVTRLSETNCESELSLTITRAR